MLFTSIPFVLLFLPVTLAGFFALGRRRPPAASGWLLLASIFFYGYWIPAFTALLIGSIVWNYGIGLQLARARAAGRRTRRSTLWLTLGIVVNLASLSYFKYGNFLVDNVSLLLGTPLHLGRILLPIGISFYTFTQIAFLVDTWQGRVHERQALPYGLFVTYFPHLIAGPVLHHSQMMPQFADPAIYRWNGGNFAGGMAIFAVGLLKKVVLADGISPYADAVFGPADAGLSPDALEAWLGTLAYTLQLYFDFSGYSDMAVGLSWMFNVRLPFNFDAPYRARNISDFWRRWHISLSTFLRDYLYIALGGNRRGTARRYANLAVTMVLGGLWHGASWSFVFWGALHGAYLMLHQGFRQIAPARSDPRGQRGSIAGLSGWALTLLAVAVGWVFFRAQSFEGALRILQGMSGGTPALPAAHSLLWNAGLDGRVGMLWCSVLGLLAVAGPNSNRLGSALLARTRTDARWCTVVASFALCMVLLLVLINAARDTASAFIYFNF